jgi:hypothetical protein
MTKIKESKLQKLAVKSSYKEFEREVLLWPKFYIGPDKLNWTKVDLRRYYELTIQGRCEKN